MRKQAGLQNTTGRGGGPVCTLPQFLQTTFPVRRLDQMLKAWHESQISSGSGEFDLRVDGLNFALNSTPYSAALQRHRSLGALFQSCTTPTPLRATVAFRKELLEMLARLCVPRSLGQMKRKWSQACNLIYPLHISFQATHGLHDSHSESLHGISPAIQEHANVLLRFIHVIRPPCRDSACLTNQYRQRSA